MTQKVLSFSKSDYADYYNFLHTPGSSNSLQRHLDGGWRILKILDDGNQIAFILERA